MKDGPVHRTLDANEAVAGVAYRVIEVIAIYPSTADARGVLAHGAAPDPNAWALLNYVRVLDGWRPRTSGR